MKKELLRYVVFFEKKILKVFIENNLNENNIKIFLNKKVLKGDNYVKIENINIYKIIYIYIYYYKFTISKSVYLLRKTKKEDLLLKKIENNEINKLYTNLKENLNYDLDFF